jgi:LAO/AO transport system kinase
VSDIIASLRSGDTRALARAISRVENGDDSAALLRSLGPSSHTARVIGITGSPGAGKSTTTSALITALRKRGEKVAVLAVDPSSPFSGGALLGDRVRMQSHSGDVGVYIRSMATRGQLGGLAASTPQAARVLEAAGFDTVIVETVGVGQSEIDIAAAADTTVVLMPPGMGDGIQAAKAGILEIGDVLAVSKADRDGADQVARELRNMIALGRDTAAAGEAPGWVPPVLLVSAMTGTGVDELIDAIDAHGAWLDQSGERRLRRIGRARDEVMAMALGMARTRIDEQRGWLDEACARIVDGGADVFTVADELAERMR